MASPDRSLSLHEIGEELDRARAARGVSRLESVVESDPSDGDHATDSASSPQTSTSSVESDHEERPLPLCLLCLTRPPSAVLLPCCHLNLCHMCAPMLILKSRHVRVADSPTLTPVVATPASPDRVPFHLALLKATANHPKSRRLSIGHCEPIPRGQPGGEVSGDDLLPTAPSARGTQAAEGSVVPGSSLGEDGRVVLDAQREEEGSGARCLICRAGVTGWLRVYTG